MENVLMPSIVLGIEFSRKWVIYQKIFFIKLSHFLMVAILNGLKNNFRTSFIYLTMK